jgi:photosystem II stability/assembly factor-like uncharacterized protein
VSFLPTATSNPPPIDWYGVAHAEGRFIVVGKSTNMLVSFDGVNWQPQLLHSNAAYLKSVVRGNGLWVAAGTAGQIFASRDGTNWAPQTSGFNYDLNDLAFGNGKFVVVGDQRPNPNATIYTSTDGTNWSWRSQNFGKNARAITYAQGLFVIALNDGQIHYTSDPDTGVWSKAETSITGDGMNLRGITFTNGFWAAVGNDGLVLTSTNAHFWKRRIVPTTENLHAVRGINGTLVAVANAGVVIQSAPLVPTLTAGRSGSGLRLNYSSPREGVFHLQESTDFSWTNLRSITNDVGTVDIELPVAPTGMRFFRIIE